MTTTQTSPKSRVPSGVPTGGQFSAEARTESGVSLASASAAVLDDRYGDEIPSHLIDEVDMPEPGIAEPPGGFDDMPVPVRMAQENANMADCPVCWGSGWAPGRGVRCAVCSHGQVTQAELEEYVTEHGAPRKPEYARPQRGEHYVTDEPDFEAMRDDQMEARDNGRGEAMEWGGMDVAS